MIFLTETKCKISFIYRIQLQKKKSGVKKWVAKSAFKWGGWGGRRLMVEVMINDHFFGTLHLDDLVFTQPHFEAKKFTHEIG